LEETTDPFLWFLGKNLEALEGSDASLSVNEFFESFKSKPFIRISIRAVHEGFTNEPLTPASLHALMGPGVPKQLDASLPHVLR
jgi:hypothetical protein